MCLKLLGQVHVDHVTGAPQREVKVVFGELDFQAEALGDRIGRIVIPHQILKSGQIEDDLCLCTCADVGCDRLIQLRQEFFECSIGHVVESFPVECSDLSCTIAYLIIPDPSL